MRQAGTISTKQDAQRFSDYLLSLGITSKVEPVDGQFAIWVHDENQLDRSKQELELFEHEPNDPRYKAAEQTARVARREAVEKKRQAQRNYIDMRNEWANPWRRRPVTMALIIMSVLVFLHLVPEQDLLISVPAHLLVVPVDAKNPEDLLDALPKEGELPEVREGEVWRLVTPIFVHFGIWHILFNMFWLYDLGTLIERRIGSVLYGVMVLAIAIPSNYLQFLATGPNFGGMSGVVFGLFGYCWIRGRLDPTSGLYLRPDIAYWMIGWFLLCTFGIIPGVANWAHGIGLGVGAALGYLAYINGRMR